MFFAFKIDNIIGPKKTIPLINIINNNQHLFFFTSFSSFFATFKLSNPYSALSNISLAS